MPATKTYMRSNYCVGRELTYGGFRASSVIRLVHLLLLAIRILFFCSEAFCADI